MFSVTLAVLALVAPSLATVFITAPVAATTLVGGEKTTIRWMDSGSAPSLQDFGPAKISIYVGNAQQQTSLQTIVPSVDVSTSSSVDFTPDPTIGPDSEEYFIRVESLSLKDAAQPQFPALAFSSKFSMSGMTGNFTPAIEAQIDGQSTAPIAGATSGSPSATNAAASSTPSAATTSKPASSAAASASKSGASSSASAKPTNTSGALGVKAVWAGVALSCAAAVFAML